MAFAALAVLAGCGVGNTTDMAPRFLTTTEVAALTAATTPPDSASLVAQGDALRARANRLRALP